MRFSLCPCGFFCKDCLIISINREGILKGIFWHIVFHTPLGFLWIWSWIRKPFVKDQVDSFLFLTDELTDYFVEE
jgi:hypothetical protein